MNIFDFFAGPGTDAEGNPGSPLIIQDEMRACCETLGELKSNEVTVRLHFNDSDADNVRQLGICLEENKCPKDCCTPLRTAMPFSKALEKYLPTIQKRQTANLIIMDQCGIKEVTPEVVNTLAQCNATDILFFVSSSFIHRFAEEPSFQKRIRMSSDQLSASPYRSIHRSICQYFRSELPAGTTFHLAPFSLKKPEGNIYGVIFGSGSLRGLVKFLKVCWALDNTTGEANYDIDDDRINRQQRSLFSELDVPKKLDGFNRDLEERLLNGILRSNRDVYRFTLEQGCLPKHAREHLRKLQDSGRLEVINSQSNQPARKRTFYLTWEAYDQDDEPRVAFRLKE